MYSTYVYVYLYAYNLCVHQSEGQTSELALPKAFAEVEVRVYVDTYEIKRPENYDYKEIET